MFASSDLNECAEGDLCLGGVCRNTEGSYICTDCRTGYQVSEDQQRCEGKSCPARVVMHHTQPCSGTQVCCN